MTITPSFRTTPQQQVRNFEYTDLYVHTVLMQTQSRPVMPCVHVLSIESMTNYKVIFSSRLFTCNTCRMVNRTFVQRYHKASMSSNGDESKKQVKIPSEFHFSEKWDSLIEQSLIRGTVGLAAGGLAGLVLASMSILMRMPLPSDSQL